MENNADLEQNNTGELDGVKTTILTLDVQTAQENSVDNLKVGENNEETNFDLECLSPTSPDLIHHTGERVKGPKRRRPSQHKHPHSGIELVSEDNIKSSNDHDKEEDDESKADTKSVDKKDAANILNRMLSSRLKSPMSPPGGAPNFLSELTRVQSRRSSTKTPPTTPQSAGEKQILKKSSSNPVSFIEEPKNEITKSPSMGWNPQLLQDTNRKIPIETQMDNLRRDMNVLNENFQSSLSKYKKDLDEEILARKLLEKEVASLKLEIEKENKC